MAISPAPSFERHHSFPPNPALQILNFETLLLEIDSHCDGWEEAYGDLERLIETIERAVEKALALGCAESTQSLSAPLMMSVILANDTIVHDLNHEWRDKDKPTNVLSFALCETETTESLTQQAPAPIQLGELVIALETVLREAKEQGKDALAHLIHLCVHGTLHLVGFDHITDEEALHMERLETIIITELGYPAPYETDTDG